MPIKTTILSSRRLSTRCRCGNYPTIGGRFWYTSKYDGCLVEGIIEKIEGASIISTKGVSYYCGDIEVVRLDITRNEKLNELGIKNNE